MATSFSKNYIAADGVTSMEVTPLGNGHHDVVVLWGSRQLRKHLTLSTSMLSRYIRQGGFTAQ